MNLQKMKDLYEGQADVDEVSNEEWGAMRKWSMRLLYWPRGRDRKTPPNMVRFWYAKPKHYEVEGNAAHFQTFLLRLPQAWGMYKYSLEEYQVTDAEGCTENKVGVNWGRALEYLKKYQPEYNNATAGAIAIAIEKSIVTAYKAYLLFETDLPEILEMVGE